MKHLTLSTVRLSLNIFAATLLTLAVSGSLSARADTNDVAGTNAMPNGDLALTTDPTWPDTWPKSKGVTFEKDNGVSFLRLKSAKAGDMVMIFRDIAIPANAKNLKVTVRYRTTDMVAGEQKWFDARTIFHFLNADGKNLTPEPKPMRFVQDATDWQEISAVCAVPEGAVKFVFMPTLFKVASGTLDLASVTVTAAP